MKVQDKTAFDEQNIFGQGMANTAFAQYFIGNSYLKSSDQAGGKHRGFGKRHL